MSLYSCISVAKMSWSTSSRIDSKKMLNTQIKQAEELFPTPYHWYLDMFNKSKAHCIPPMCKYDFKSQPIPDAQPQENKVIPLSQAYNRALNKKELMTGLLVELSKKLHSLGQSWYFLIVKYTDTSNHTLITGNQMVCQ